MQIRYAAPAAAATVPPVARIDVLPACGDVTSRREWTAPVVDYTIRQEFESRWTIQRKDNRLYLLRYNISVLMKSF